jgi:uncharacterized phage protein (TIGR01671 family)
MNRQLKFRVWDKLAERMIYPHNDNQQHFIIDLNGRFHNLQNGSGGDDYVIQQYTGLNDINGKEVYDGDLVELHTAANDHAIGVKGNHCGLYEMYWDRYYKLKTIKPNWFFVPTFEGPAADYNIMKVVGNIFENKELLKTI